MKIGVRQGVPAHAHAVRSLCLCLFLSPPPRARSTRTAYTHPRRWCWHASELPCDTGFPPRSRCGQTWCVPRPRPSPGSASPTPSRFRAEGGREGLGGGREAPGLVDSGTARLFLSFFLSFFLSSRPLALRRGAAWTGGGVPSMHGSTKHAWVSCGSIY